MLLSLLFKRLKYFFAVLVVLPGISFMQAQDYSDLLPDTVRSCRVDSLMLDADQGFGHYMWSTGDTTSFLWVKSEGGYWLNFTSGDTINETDTTWVFILDARIAQSDTTISCGDTISLNGDNGAFQYIWTPGWDTAQSVTVYPRDTTQYFVKVRDTGNSYYYCTDSVTVTVDPIVLFDTIIQLNMGCKGENKTQMKVDVSGGYPPYYYDWSAGYSIPGQPNVAIGFTDGNESVTVTDTIGCFNIKNFEVKAYPLPELEIHTDPGDTVYYQKPFITFSYENLTYDSLGVDTFQITSLQWDFGDNATAIQPSVTHTYSDVGDFTVVLNYITFYGCPGEDSTTIKVKPIKLKVPSVITPNGDGFNDYFIIDEDESGDDGGEAFFKSSSPGEYKTLDTYYLKTTLLIFNQWGNKVYEKENYANDWTGDNLIDGSYYYILKCEGQYDTDIYRGTFMILGSGEGY